MSDNIGKFEEFFRKFYYDKLLKAVSEGKNSVVVDYRDLERFDPILADMLIKEPQKVIEEMKSSIKNIDIGTESPLELRFDNIPDSEKVRIKDIRSEHIGKFIKVEGVVRRASEVNPEVKIAIFECPDCGSKIEVPQLEEMLTYPTSCDCGRKRGFKLIGTKLHDTRYIVLEDPFETTVGEKPGEVRVFLKDDLTTPEMQRKTDPGARLEITGILKELPKRIAGRRTKQLEKYIECNFVKPVELELEELEITEDDKKKIEELASDPNIYDKLIMSIAPSMYGLEEVKEALLLQLFGGVPQVLPDGTNIRGDIHVLIVGDPSSGKTQLLKLISKLVPRGRYVSGKGTTAAGLCVTGDTLVVLENGEIAKIGDIVEDELKRNGKKIHSRGIYKSKNPTKIKILGLDEGNMKIKPLKVNQYWKIKALGRLLRIKTRLGKDVEVTENNPMPVFENGRIIWKKARELTKDDFLCIPRRIETESPGKIYITDFLDKTPHLRNSSEVVNNFVNIIKENGGIREFSKSLGISEDSLYYAWRDDNRVGAPKLSILEKISGKLGLDLDEYLPDKLILSQKNGHTISLPKVLNEDVMYLLGLLAGDGNMYTTKYGGIGIRFTNSNMEMLSSFSSLCNDMGIETIMSKRKDRTPTLRFASKIIGDLALNFGIPIGSKRKRLKISKKLSKLPNNLLSAYIRGIFDTDGSVIDRKDGASYVDVTSASKNFLEIIQILLLRFGIISKIRERNPTKSLIRGRMVNSNEKYSLEIKGKENLEKFKINIGFGLGEKKNKLNKIIKRIKKYDTNIDLVPGVGSLLKKARKQFNLSAKELYGYKNYSYESGERSISKRKLREIVDKLVSKGYKGELTKIAYSDLFFDKIKEIKEIKSPRWIYDLTVDGEHSFLANGLIVHNTATVTRDEEFMGGWILEAGAVVLANKSVIAIDEFDKMSKEDQINLHEAMSTQSYHPDTIIDLADGSQEKIKDIVEKLFKKYKSRIVKGKSCLMLRVPENENIELLSTDFERIFSKKPIRVSKHKAPRYFYKIKTSSGREIKVTPEHPCWTIKNGKILCKRADSIREGDWVPVPGKLPIEGRKQSVDINLEERKNTKQIKIPSEFSPNFYKFLGYLVSDGGYEMNRGIKNGINFTNTNPVLIEDFRNVMSDTFGLDKVYIQERIGNTKKRTMLRYISSNLVKLLREVDPTLMEGYDKKKLPNNALRGRKEDVLFFLRKAFDGDGGNIKKERGFEIVYTTSSKELALQISNLLLRFGIVSKIRESKSKYKDVFRVAISEEDNIRKFLEKIGFTDSKLNSEIKKYLKSEKSLRKGLFDTVPEVGNEVFRLLKTLNISQKPLVGWTLTSYKNNKISFTRQTLKRILPKIEDKYLELLGEIKHLNNLKGDMKELKRIRREFGIKAKEISNRLRISVGSLYYREKNCPQFFEDHKKAILDSLRDKISVGKTLEFLKKLTFGDIKWLKVDEIKKEINKNVKWVYDVTVPGEIFISNGLVLHNTVSISKATIQATLPAQTSIVAGCNPKLSRFDSYRPIAEQIDIPDTLLSRFDLKFILRDIPDRERDEKLVDHVIKTRIEEDKVRPAIETDFLRKYVAYARKNVKPKLTRKALAICKNFFVDLRSKYASEESTVPLTLRQYEALIRLSEAAAKIRLSDKVEEQDAKRAIKIMKRSIEQLGYDSDTGKIDIDRVEGGVPSSKRNKIRIVMDTLDELEKTMGKNIPMSDLISALEEEGVDEHTAESIIREMKNKGMLFEPRSGYIQKI